MLCATSFSFPLHLAIDVGDFSLGDLQSRFQLFGFITMKGQLVEAFAVGGQRSFRFVHLAIKVAQGQPEVANSASNELNFLARCGSVSDSVINFGTLQDELLQVIV